jgi:uncharacterized protein (DUF1697 family)
VWILLLRAVNLGPTNKLAMQDLRAVLEGLGHTDVRTVLNSGNATFRAPGADPRALAAAVEGALDAELGLSLRAVVRSAEQVAAMLEAVPADLDGYVVVSVLFDPPDPAALQELARWEPERVVPGDGVLYLSYERMTGSKLTNALIEKRLGVSTTARTPATLRKLLRAVTCRTAAPNRRRR